MSSQTTDDHGIDPSTESKAEYGVSASRKAMLSRCRAPLSVLNAHGIPTPGREFLDDYRDERPITTTLTLSNDVDGERDNGRTRRVHLHQNVRERPDTDGFGDFGPHDPSEEQTVWTVVGLPDPDCDPNEATIRLTVVGDWSKRRSVPPEELLDDYEPVTTVHGRPVFGY